MDAAVPVKQKMGEFDVVVVGSCMIDLISYAPRLPKVGETLQGSHFTQGFGGKGCNQCVAARKLGANCLLVARVGNDSFGENYCKKLQEYGIILDHVKADNYVCTGIAQIIVADNGENHIVIVLGANEKLSEADVLDASDAIEKCKVLLCQMEISECSTIKALQIKANSKNGKSILNAAPATPDFNPLLFSLPDIFCVNETEAEILTHLKVSSPKNAEEAAKKLFSMGCNSVIITLGENGAVYGEKKNSKFVHVPAMKVNAVDTTGAGDAFLGALAHCLSKYPDCTMEEMIRKANEVAAYSVQKLGTQESFPLMVNLLT